MAADLMTRIRRRHEALARVRRFFEERGFCEVETQMLVPAPTTEPHIDPLEVWVRTSPEGERALRFLHTSPELSLKRVLAGGAERVFQVARVFRDGERGPIHLPEFTLLEWYRAGGTLDDLLADTEALLEALAEAFWGGPKIPLRGGGELDVRGPFPRKSVAELFAEHAGIDLSAALLEMEAGNALALVEAAKRAGFSLRPGADFEDAFFQVMGSAVEPALPKDRPLVVERWPKQMAVLSRLLDDDPRYAGRFELYAGGLELANAFDELTDPEEQRARFWDDNRARKALGKPELPFDEVFLEELSRMPRSAGIALGLDRVLLLLFQAERIDEVYALPWR